MMGKRDLVYSEMIVSLTSLMKSGHRGQAEKS